ncbi:hypothetical protein D3C78_1830110 [compost metagenome]
MQRPQSVIGRGGRLRIHIGLQREVVLVAEYLNPDGLAMLVQRFHGNKFIALSGPQGVTRIRGIAGFCQGAVFKLQCALLQRESDPFIECA